MRSMLGQLIRTGAVCGMLMIMNPFTSMASIGPGFTAGTYVATITSESVNINRNMDSEEVLMTARTGNTYEVLEDLGNGWMKVRAVSYTHLLGSILHAERRTDHHGKF